MSSNVQKRSRSGARTLLVLAVSLQSALACSADEVFDRWAARHAVPLTSADTPRDGSDLSPLGTAIGSAPLVAFGEAQHNTHELLAMRNRLFRYLVERKGFTAIALESGFTESLQARTYVEGGEGDAGSAAMSGLSAGLGMQAENVELLQWMHDYNLMAEAAGRRRIRLYGMDITSGGRRSGPWRSMDWALSYLARADPAAAQRIRDRVAVRLPRDDEREFGPLSGDMQKDFEAGIDALAMSTRANRALLIARSSSEDYRIALRNIEAARQLARCLPVTPAGQTNAKAWLPAVVCRDREMAENVNWALANEGRTGRLLLFAANEHVMSWKQDGRRLLDVSDKPPMMGAHLRRDHGDALYIIASTFASAAPELGTPMPSERSLDRNLARLNQAHLFLDLRGARADWELLAWLSIPQGLTPNLAADLLLTPATAFDALLFTERLTPARLRLRGP